jgi:hypothetical protein
MIYRKSTLLNLLLDRNVKSGASFAVGGTVQACTKGMWMCQMHIQSPSANKKLPHFEFI